MTLKEAQEKKCCRLCEEPIIVYGAPKDWMISFYQLSYPPPVIILDYGDEFAHKHCLDHEKANQCPN